MREVGLESGSLSRGLGLGKEHGHGSFRIGGGASSSGLSFRSKLRGAMPRCSAMQRVGLEAVLRLAWASGAEGQSRGSQSAWALCQVVATEVAAVHSMRHSATRGGGGGAGETGVGSAGAPHDASDMDRWGDDWTLLPGVGAGRGDTRPQGDAEDSRRGGTADASAPAVEGKRPPVPPPPPPPHRSSGTPAAPAHPGSTPPPPPPRARLSTRPRSMSLSGAHWARRASMMGRVSQGTRVQVGAHSADGPSVTAVSQLGGRSSNSRSGGGSARLGGV